MINIVVITHGEFGAYLVEAAENIVGAQPAGLKNISVSSRLSLERVKALVTAAAAEMASEDGLLFLIDMPGGTPMNVTLPVARDIPRSAVICGVNINMMMSAFAGRRTMQFEPLVEKILEDGKKAVCEVKRLLVSK